MAHAEGVVRDAWLRALRSECDHTGAEMHAASAHCDAAQRNLAAARLGRDPEAIAVAHADLDGRLVSARIAARAYGQAREALDRELSMACHQAGDQFLDEYVSRGWTPGSPDESPSVLGAIGAGRARRTVRALIILGWLSQCVVSSVLRGRIVTICRMRNRS